MVLEKGSNRTLSHSFPNNSYYLKNAKKLINHFLTITLAINMHERKEEKIKELSSIFIVTQFFSSKIALEINVRSLYRVVLRGRGLIFSKSTSDSPDSYPSPQPKNSQKEGKKLLKWEELFSCANST